MAGGASTEESEPLFVLEPLPELSGVIDTITAANPLLFVLGFICGTSALHLFGVAIGYFAIKTAVSSILLRLTGITFAIYGMYLFFGIFYI